MQPIRENGEMCLSVAWVDSKSFICKFFWLLMQVKRTVWDLSFVGYWLVIIADLFLNIFYVSLVVDL